MAKKVVFELESPIISSISEPITTKELVDRLRNVCDQLSALDQDLVDLDSLAEIKKDLVNQKLIKHNNQGVQAYVSCCLAEILRLYAPDAPYTATQLTNIFRLFISQFKKLLDEESPYYLNLYNLLKRVVEVKSIALMTDLPAAEKLTDELFKGIYDICKHSAFPEKVDTLISDLLSEVISESDSISLPVLKLILNKFMANKTVSDSQHKNIRVPGFSITLNICKTNTDRLSRQVTQYFSEVIYEVTANENGTNQVSLDPDTLDQLRKLHGLCIEIWKYVPDLLLSVMGVLDNELDADSEQIRELATLTIGKIASVQPSDVNFVKVHQDSWNNWRKKILDISSRVRASWVSATFNIIENRTDINDDIVTGITKALLDTDLHVRLNTVKVFNKLQPETFVSKLLSRSIMDVLIHLLREKNYEIRKESISFVSNLYNRTFIDLYAADKKLDDTIGTIPSAILNLVYINSTEINQHLDLALFEKILPFDNIDENRARRCLTVLKHLDTKARSAFVAILKRQRQLSDVLTQFVGLCEAYNGGNPADKENKETLIKKIDKVSNWISLSIPPDIRPISCLNRFVAENSKRYYKLIKIAISTESNYDTVRNALKELFNHLSSPSKEKTSMDSAQVTPEQMVSTFKLLLYRTAVIISNQSNMHSLFEIANQNGELANTAQELIETISETSPAVFKSQIHQFTNILRSICSAKSYHKATEERSLVKTLKTIYHYAKQYPQEMNMDESLTIALQFICEKGTPTESRFAVKILGLQGEKSILKRILATIYPLDDTSEHLASHLCVISEMFLLDDSLLESVESDLTSTLIKDYLLKNKIKQKEDHSEFVSDDELETKEFTSCAIKIYSLKVIVNRLRASHDAENSKELAEPVLKLLFFIIGNSGEIVNEKDSSYPSPQHFKTRLRLMAGLSFLKLAKYPTYSKMMKPSLVYRLIFLVQDENETIREAFLNELQKYLAENHISDKFLPLVFFTAYEPLDGLKAKTLTWMRSTYKRFSSDKSKPLIFEKSLVRLIHMIAHFPEFVDSLKILPKEPEKASLVPTLISASEYIIEFLEVVATEKNISLLYYLATQVKKYQDGLFSAADYDLDENPVIYNLYRVSELAQVCIKLLSLSKSWNVQTWPGKVQLPGDIFSSMKSIKEAQDIVSISFLPDQVVVEVENAVRARIARTNSRKDGLRRNKRIKTAA
ncbi:Sister chromatid cohesion protein [Komagataella phaffii CBS 7435]|uniref:Protein required for establishment and maintenance of sister chromatid condensation and cohesion n=2 Tax=Komagataella phaffii TaxID=460519 RepID=C4R3R5_KOMPG|nr:Protein required for establishment and maintenance of sister chromatid condensation and cohesion [Komagataella phaffii GS115]AOA63890.1 GQ67_03195T0 [Komagataella phaffii]CAH2450083.1 Sister chromatid cohesion protein [Komagataella phaffii CBS 7435]AOA68571.1 GQ68_03180T0 [Komagataella phaffii GS115]CAY70140.1 Protein required for establishment and maintenance of sister chromatid condensation and cohesion [Komagataella phaffii GS115]CCA40003.1 Sister chromatid cohesion protein [Komagataella